MLDFLLTPFFPLMMIADDIKLMPLLTFMLASDDMNCQMSEEERLAYYQEAMKRGLESRLVPPFFTCIGKMKVAMKESGQEMKVARKEGCQAMNVPINEGGLNMKVAMIESGQDMEVAMIKGSQGMKVARIAALAGLIVGIMVAIEGAIIFGLLMTGLCFVASLFYILYSIGNLL